MSRHAAGRNVSAKNARLRLALILALAVITAGASCEDGPVDPDPDGDLPGSVSLVLADAPASVPGLESFFVRFASIQIHRSASADEETEGWIAGIGEDLDPAERTFDVAALVNGITEEAFSVTMDPGRYGQIRVVVDTAWATVDGASAEVQIPSGSTSGIKLVGSFEVLAGEETELLLDFDLGRSLRVIPGTGVLQLHPVIRFIQTDRAGSISGTITPVEAEAAVIAYATGSSDVVTTTLADPATGGYMLQGLPPGSYTVEASAAGYQTASEEGITVTARTDHPGVDFQLVPEGGE